MPKSHLYLLPIIAAPVCIPGWKHQPEVLHSRLHEGDQGSFSGRGPWMRALHGLLPWLRYHPASQGASSDQVHSEAFVGSVTRPVLNYDGRVEACYSHSKCCLRWAKHSLSNGDKYPCLWKRRAMLPQSLAVMWCLTSQCSWRPGQMYVPLELGRSGSHGACSQTRGPHSSAASGLEALSA